VPGEGQSSGNSVKKKKKSSTTFTIVIDGQRARPGKKARDKTKRARSTENSAAHNDDDGSDNDSESSPHGERNGSSPTNSAVKSPKKRRNVAKSKKRGRSNSTSSRESSSPQQNESDSPTTDNALEPSSLPTDTTGKSYTKEFIKQLAFLLDNNCEQSNFHVVLSISTTCSMMKAHAFALLPRLFGSFPPDPNIPMSGAHLRGQIWFVQGIPNWDLPETPLTDQDLVDRDFICITDRLELDRLRSELVNYHLNGLRFKGDNFEQLPQFSEYEPTVRLRTIITEYITLLHRQVPINKPFFFPKSSEDIGYAFDPDEDGWFGDNPDSAGTSDEICDQSSDSSSSDNTKSDQNASEGGTDEKQTRTNTSRYGVHATGNSSTYGATHYVPIHQLPRRVPPTAELRKKHLDPKGEIKDFNSFMKVNLDSIDRDTLSYAAIKEAEKLDTSDQMESLLARYSVLVDKTSADKLVINQSTSHPRSVLFRPEGSFKSNWRIKPGGKLHAAMCALDCFEDPASLKGLSKQQKVRLMKRALKASVTTSRTAQQELAAILNKIHVLDAERPSNPPNRPLGYDLAKLGLSGFKRRLRNAHLSPDAAFASTSFTSKMPSNFAILDSGASKHFVTEAIGKRLQRRCKFRVAMCNANGIRTTVDQAGDIVISCIDNSGHATGVLDLVCANVVPNSKFSLISTSQLASEGVRFVQDINGTYIVKDGFRYDIQVHDGVPIIDLDKDLVANSEDKDFTYFSAEDEEDRINDDDDGSSAAAAALACASTASSLERWHDRLGHASKERINLLQKSGKALGLNIKGQGVHNGKCKCDSCLRTNNVSRSIGKSREFADTVSRCGELLTSDVLGPFPPTPEGHRYAISFVDEFSRYSHCYFLGAKSDAPAALQSVIDDYRSHGIIIKTVRTDQGGEFGGHNERPTLVAGNLKIPSTSRKDFYTKSFDRLCAKYGIKHELTPAYVPALHGVAERWNRTCMTMANSMLFHARISPVLWSSAVAHANFLRNRLPTKSRSGVTPYELFTNRRPRYDNLRVWGCYCYKLLPVRDKTPGLPVRKRLIYMGESSNRIGFRCFDPDEYKFTTEYELLFDEDGIKHRTSLLEAFDTRRKQIKEGNISSVDLVGSPRAAGEHERAVYLPSSSSKSSSSVGTGDGRAPTSAPSTTTPRKVTLQSIPEESSDSSSSSDYSSQGNSSSSSESGEESDQENLEATHVPSTSNRKHAPLRSTSRSSSSKSSIKPRTPSDYGAEASSNEGTPRYCDLSTCYNESEEEEPLKRVRRKPVRLGYSSSAVLAPRVEDSIDPPSPNNVCKVTDTSAPYDPTYWQTHLNGDEFDILTDEEALVNGPLTSDYLTSDLAQFVYSLDTAHLLCPRRYLPVGKAVPISSEMKKFLQLAQLKNLPIEVRQLNPKQERSQSYIRYEVSKSATTVREYFSKLRAKGLERPHGKSDFQEDFARGYISFPSNTQPSLHHDLACVFSYDSIDFISSHPISGHVYSAPVSDTFQDIVRAMWSHDPEPTVEELLRRDARAHAIISSLTVEGLPEPSTYEKAVHHSHPERDKWIAAIDEEVNTLVDRGTWSYVPRFSLKKDKKPIRCKFVFKKKVVKNGDTRYKARLVACGYSQQVGLDYASDELYASVCSYASMRFLMSLATQKKYILYQTDIQGAYLESYLDPTLELYMEVPKSLPQVDEKGNPRVCRLHRGLYGLKQSGYAWSQCFKEFMIDPKYNMNFTAMTGEQNLYRCCVNLNGIAEEIFVGQYVDDCLLAASSQTVLTWFLDALKARFPVNPKSSGFISPDDPGLILSMHVYYDMETGTLKFNQLQSVEALAKKFQLNDAQQQRALPIGTDDNLPKLTEPESKVILKDYMSIVGSCLHIAQVSRPDIAYAVGVLSRHCCAPGQIHLNAALDLVKYLYSTRHLSIQYHSSDSGGNSPQVFEHGYFPGQKTENVEAQQQPAVPATRSIEDRLIADVPTPHPNEPITFMDANLGGDRHTRKSTSGMVIMMNGGPIDWSSRLQKLCAQSSAEAEIYAVTDGVKQALHVRLLCEESGIRAPDIPMTIWEDNQACIQMGHMLKGSNNAKHFELRLRFLNEHVWSRNIEFSKIDTKDQLADGFTKALARPAFEQFRNQLLVSSPLPTS